MKSTLHCGLTPSKQLAEPAAVHIGAVRFDVINRREALETLMNFIENGGPHLVCSPNLDGVVLCQRDIVLRDIINHASLSIADGMGIVYASRLIGRALPENVGGRLLMLDLCRVAADQGYRIFLLGGEAGIAERAAGTLRKLFPGIKIAGTFAPPMGFGVNSRESDECVMAVRAAQPDCLFVAFGSPKQEKWLYENLKRLNVPVSMYIGYALDLLALKFPAPPEWMTAMGLEWVFRLWHDPVRLAKRYLWRDIGFIPILLSEIWNHRFSKLAVPRT
jgi:N-acetylglucosaminyldiphosphoundecaprenol N-acetyl-beta-D-mannosaminyltransferase